MPFNSQLRTSISPFLDFAPMTKIAPGGVRYPVLAIIIVPESDLFFVWFLGSRCEMSDMRIRWS